MTTLSYADLGHRTSADGWPEDRWLREAPDASVVQRNLRTAILTALLGLSVGTGASAVLPAFAVNASSSMVICATVRTQSERIRAALPLSTREKLMALRRYFSLNVSELSRSLRIERPTVYSWLTESADPHTRNIERLNRLYRLGQSWRRSSATPVGGANKIQLSGGRTLLDLFAEEELDNEAILATFAELRGLLADQRIKARNRESIADAGRRMGLRDVPREVQQYAFDAETDL